MQIVKEDLWKLPPMPGMVVVTTNGYINKDGSLVMGRGAALEATKRIPGIAKQAGDVIWNAGFDSPAMYYFLTARSPFREGKLGFGLFQVKRIWSDEADIGIIRQSVMALRTYASRHPELNIRMNFPGIGNGRLKRVEVEPHLEPLPDNVTICVK